MGFLYSFIYVSISRIVYIEFWLIFIAFLLVVGLVRIMSIFWILYYRTWSDVWYKNIFSQFLHLPFIFVCFCGSFFCCVGYLLFVLGPHLAVVRNYSWVCAQVPLLAGSSFIWYDRNLTWVCLSTILQQRKHAICLI